MEDNQIEYVGMFVKVKTFLTKKAAALAATPIIASSIKPALSTKISEILTEEQDASSPITGSTELKKNLRTDVEDKGFEVAAACAAYYTITVPNPVLRVKCEFERSDLSNGRMRDSDLYVRMSKVHEIAEPVKTLLSDFGVAGADVDALETALNDLFIEIQGPKDAIGARAASGKQVDRLILQARKIIDTQLDVVMKYYLTNDPELYDYYLTARSIDQTGGGPIPDEDETMLLASGAFGGGAFSSDMNDNSKIVVICGASNGAEARVGFSNMPNSFSGTQLPVPPGVTLDEKAIDLGFVPGITNLVFQNTGAPISASIKIRVKVYY